MKSARAHLATLIGLTLIACTNTGLAGEAETSASATAHRNRAGTATATARYVGDLGFARTDTRTGKVNIARGVAVGLDKDGLSVSLSTAIAPSRGPALGVNFNMSIAANGEVSHSTGRSVARGGNSRTATVGGKSTTTRYGAVSTSLASGRTTGGGTVTAKTNSHTSRPARRIVRTVHRVVRSR